jgi:hypothetical protein
MLISYLVYTSTLQMEAICSPTTSVIFQKAELFMTNAEITSISKYDNFTLVPANEVYSVFDICKPSVIRNSREFGKPFLFALYGLYVHISAT